MQDELYEARMLLNSMQIAISRIEHSSIYAVQIEARRQDNELGTPAD